MIYSMTAFARLEKRDNFGAISCEIRSINHRYLELALRLPENLSQIEFRLREIMREHLQRGKIDCVIRYQANPQQSNQFIVNHPLAEQLLSAAREVAHMSTTQLQMDVLDILRWPGVLQNAESDLTSVQNAIVELFSQCIKELVKTRAREGEALQTFIEQRLEEMSTRLAKIQKRLPKLRENLQNKFLTRLTELNISVDPQRLEQEIVLYMQKIDVAEEMDRIATHLKEYKRTLKAGGAVGRRLDFLVQELNREVNTMGSKVNDSDISHEVVELKVLLEQVREQIQNIE